MDDVSVSFDGLQGDEIGNVHDARWWHPSELTTEVTLSDLDLAAVARAAVAATV